MNLERLKLILNQQCDPFLIEDMLIEELAKDEKVVSLVLELLDKEREQKKNLITEMNFQLSRADVGLDNKKFNKDNFIQAEIKSFYEKFKGMVGHCFKNYTKQ